MSKATGVKGKTPGALSRAHRAEQRTTARAARTVEEQLALLDGRPGAAQRERARLTRGQSC